MVSEGPLAGSGCASRVLRTSGKKVKAVNCLPLGPRAQKVCSAGEKRTGNDIFELECIEPVDMRKGNRFPPPLEVCGDVPCGHHYQQTSLDQIHDERSSGAWLLLAGKIPVEYLFDTRQNLAS
ncbi:MAG: hypothetical protein RL518_899 [Pseudomonadota bacterium]